MCVGFLLCCAQPRISQKTLPKHTRHLSGPDHTKRQGVLSLRVLPLLLLDMPLTTTYCLPHRHGVSGFLKEIGGFGFFLGGGGIFLLNVNDVSSHPTCQSRSQMKSSPVSWKSLEKHPSPALCPSLVLGLSEPNWLAAPALGGLRCLQGWHGRWHCPSQGMPIRGAAPPSSPHPPAEG